MKKVLLLILLFILIPINVLAASNPYGQWQTYMGATTVRCTWYAWKNAYEIAGVALPAWGNAATWYQSAINAGYSVGKEAKANSIMVLSGSDGYGHVAYVTSVNGDILTTNEGGLYQTENIYCEDGYSVCGTQNVAVNGNGIADGYKRSMYEISGSLLGFIYLDDAPKTPSNSGSTSTNTKVTTTVQTTTKSGDNYLSSLTLSMGVIDFNKDVLEYNVKVDYKVKKISINSTSSSDKATITGNGDKDLKVGNNSFAIEVTAEDESKRTYTINVERSKKKVTTTKKAKEVKKDKNILYIIISSVIAGILVISFVIIKCIKKKGKKKNKAKK